MRGHGCLKEEGEMARFPLKLGFDSELSLFELLSPRRGAKRKCACRETKE